MYFITPDLASFEYKQAVVEPLYTGPSAHLSTVVANEPARITAPVVSATAVVTPESLTLPKVRPMLPDLVVDNSGTMTTTIPTIVKDNSRMEANPMLPVLPLLATSWNPIPILFIVTDFQTQP